MVFDRQMAVVAGGAASSPGGGSTPAPVTLGIPVVKRTASFMLTAEDIGKIIDCESSSPITVTIPTSLSAGFPDDSVVTLRRTGTGEVTVAAGSGVTLRSPSDPAGLRARSQWSSVELSRRPGGAPDFPSSDLAFRYRADDISAADLAPVTSWPSAISDHPAAAQGTAANQPKLRTGVMNGRNAVEFDGTNDNFPLSGVVLDAARNRTDLLITACYQLPGTAVTGNRAIFSLSTGTTTGARVYLGQNTTGNVHLATGRRLDADGFAQAVATSGSTTNETGILTGLWRWSTSDLLLFKNGTQVASNTSFQTAGATSDTRSLTGFIGGNAAGTGEYFLGKLAEVAGIATNDADGSVRAAVHSYFVNMYGASSSDYLGPHDEWVVSGDTKV